MTPIAILPITEDHIGGFRFVLDSVAPKNPIFYLQKRRP